ncbi:radical SAM family heme chaperone HemW [Jannaschia pohangensis]|uniref:Heme chaperone HemW n=1 Tax=Jannaschia pohangensis TaxID=390807 RepID=A0A1I3TDX8_9RHOB|nr:radical SAM family heme chaperone HemW [Jannaschia pohangensis]SFJ69135.1 oxygen-independent coproporphyrinogen-3 oxidase [Jannaschia pohangensis]
MENWQRGGFGLYVHWPFCAAKCPYCDFNSHVVAAVDQDRWRKALLRDLAHWAERTPGRILTSIFFGGGTPSLMPPETVGAIIEAARGHWTPANDLEVTLEANPTSVEAARFSDFTGAGVNRFSVGLQALNDVDLRRLGRLHSASEGRRAFEIAKSATDRVSFDLIYARQDQTAAMWEAELTEALTFAGEHLSLYQLTIEDGTAFGARHAAGGLRGLPDEDMSADMYEVTQGLCEAAGLHRYETSNHAAEGAASRHNLIYWAGGDWLGIGPGAHGRLAINGSRHATVAARMPGDWVQKVEQNGAGVVSDEILQTSDIFEEYILMSLRTRRGADLSHIAALGAHLDQQAVDDLIDQGLLMSHDGYLATTDRGAMLVNPILRQIIPG